MNYTAKNIHTFAGRQGEGFSATLHGDGTLIAYVRNLADGGCYDWDVEDRPAFDAFKADAAAKFPEYEIEQEDSAMSALLDDYRLDKRLKRACKTKTMIHLRGTPPGEFFESKLPYSPETKARLLAKHPEVDEFINERYLKKATA